MAAEYSTKLNPEPKTSYLTIDRLGSPRVITDRSGNVISRRDFMPFGEEIYAGVGGRTTIQKYSGAGIDNIRQRFTGYEKDDETDVRNDGFALDFAQARMYQNKHGRFISVDPLMSSASALNPQSFNRYTYTGNNPVNFTDPNGLRWVRENSSIYWIDDKDPLNGREDVTGQTIYLDGGCDETAGCVTPGTTVTFNSDRTITVNSVGNEPVISESVEVKDDSAETIETDATAVTSTIQSEFSSTPTTGAPWIDLPTSPGPGPLEPIEGGSPSGGADTGGGDVDAGGGDINPGDVDAGGGGFDEVTLAKIGVYIAYVWWKTRDASDGGEDDELVYHGTTSEFADDIVSNGLNEDKWRNSDPTGIDEKDFSVTSDPEVASQWAEWRAALRGGTPAVISAKRSDLKDILRKGGRGLTLIPMKSILIPKISLKYQAIYF